MSTSAIANCCCRRSTSPSYYRLTLPAEALAIDPDRALAALREASRAAERILLDIDCDVLDPAIFPAVGQPVPFGLSCEQLLRWLDAVWSERVIGVAVSEFDPARDRDDRSLAILIWLLERLLLRHYERT